MKSSRQLSIVAYGIIVTVVGLVLYVGLTVLAIKQLDILRVSHEEKRLISAKAELKKAMGNLTAATEKLVEKFYNWEELLQQINDPTYYTYWRENRVAFVNFVPSYFMKISLFDRDGRSVISAGREKIKHSF